MIEYETIWVRTVVLVARASMLDAPHHLVPGRGPLGAFETVSALHRHVLIHVRDIVRGLRRELDDADTVVSEPARATLQRVALGKAACGLAVLEAEPGLAETSGSRVPFLCFSSACKALTLALCASPVGAVDVPDLPNLARRQLGHPRVGLHLHPPGPPFALRRLTTNSASASREAPDPMADMQGGAK